MRGDAVEKLREAHEQWTAARELVIKAASILTRNFGDVVVQGELRSALETERRARARFEKLLLEDGETQKPAARRI